MSPGAGVLRQTEDKLNMPQRSRILRSPGDCLSDFVAALSPLCKRERGIRLD